MTESLSNNIGRSANARAATGLARSFERLSSGLRINDASDDATGLALSTNLQTKSRVYTQAQRNISDGTSFLAVADNAAETLRDIVHRQKELATQASNENFTDAQREALDVEFQALSEQYNSIVGGTEFNGQHVFSSEALSVQAGYGTPENLRVGLGDATGERLPTELYHLSTDSNGNNSNGDSANPSIYGLSANGRYAVFNDSGTNLVSGDVNGFSDVFLKDTVTGETRLLSTSSSGTQGNGNSTLAVVSADGQYVAYESDANNLIAGDTNAVKDIFFTSSASATTTRVSTSSAGVEANGVSGDAAISSDGRYVVFESSATNLVAGDTNGFQDVFMKDTVTGTTTRISVSSASAEGNGNSTDASVSSDGRYVTFTSTATNLVAGDTNGLADIFVRDTVLGTTTLVSQSTDGTISNGASANSTVSKDGRYIMYDSLGDNLVSGDSNGVRDVFVRDTVSGTTSLVSYTNSGGLGNSTSSYGTISDDGRFAAFVTGSTNMVSSDTNGANDVFVRDLQLGTTTLVSVNASGVQGNAANQGPYISGDGRYVMIQTASTNMFSGDTNGFYDMLMVRRDGATGTRGMALGDMHGLQITTQIGAENALETLDSYADAITLFKGVVGAGLSRFSSADSISQVRAENYRAAVDKIMSADVAEEVAASVRYKIIRNSSAAMMAQANQQAGVVFDLLKNA